MRTKEHPKRSCLCFTWKGLDSYFPEDLLTQVPVLTQMTKQTGQEQKLGEIQMDTKYKPESVGKMNG